MVEDPLLEEEEEDERNFIVGDEEMDKIEEDKG